MKAEICGLAPIETMTVDTAFELCILDQGLLARIAQAGLIDTHLAPYFISRLDESVADSIGDCICTDLDIKWSVGGPTSPCIAATDGEMQRGTCIGR